MTVTFNTNLSALTSQRYLGIAADKAGASLSKLSSGSRVPSAKDDAAALAVGSKLKAEVVALAQASNNASQASSLLQIADGALGTVGDILQRMKALATQSSSGQLGDSERSLLNQEYVNLRDEVDRVAAVTNFNGTTLLAGSTTVIADTNGLAAFTGAGANQNDTAATDLIGNGFEAFTFSSGQGDGVIRIDYNGTTRNLTAKNLISGATQVTTLAAGAITAGNTEEYNLADVGVKIKLNSQFNKAANISASNTANVTVANADITGFTDTGTPFVGDLTGPTAVTYSITASSFTGTGANRFFADQLAGATVGVSGASTAIALGNITVGSRTFINTSAAQSVATAGNFDYNFDDGDGNTFTLRVTTTGNATAGTASGNIVFGSNFGGALENTGTNRPIVTSVVNSATPGSEFNWGSLTNARVTFNAANEAAVTAAITINGVAFSTANAGGATADFSTTGTKNLTLADANGNAFTIQSNVTRAFTATDSTGQIVLSEFGQYVASQSSTTSNTSFSFKVGTGVTSNDSITVALNAATTSTLAISTSTVTTAANADTAIGLLNSAINTISSNRASVGSAQSRLDFASNSIAVAIENFTAATSALVDVDVSAEITEFTSQNVLLQAGISLLAQANQQPSLLLRLLQ